jgi:hypothetical protein
MLDFDDGVPRKATRRRIVLYCIVCDGQPRDLFPNGNQTEMGLPRITRPPPPPATQVAVS